MYYVGNKNAYNFVGTKLFAHKRQPAEKAGCRYLLVKSAPSGSMNVVRWGAFLLYDLPVYDHFFVEFAPLREHRSYTERPYYSIVFCKKSTGHPKFNGKITNLTGKQQRL